MYARMVMNVAVDAVAPAVAPSIDLEKLFHDGGGIEFFGKFHSPSIDDERPIRMVRHQSIIFEPKLIRFSPPYKIRELFPAWFSDTGGLIDSFFILFRMLMT